MNSNEKNILSVRIKEKLKTDILSGRFSNNRMLATEQTLCKEFGASRETIRKSIDLLINEKLCERIPSRGVIITSRAEDRPNDKIEIAILTPYDYEYENYYYKDMIAGFASGSRKHNVSFSFISRNRKKSILSHDINLPLIIWPGERTDFAECCKMMNDKINFLVLSSSFEDRDIPAIDGDNRSGSEQIVSHFLDNGHQSIGLLLKNRLPSIDHSIRLAAFRNYMKTNGVSTEPAIFMPEKNIGDPRDRKNFLRWLDENSITSLFVIDFELAASVYELCEENSISIPERLSVVAFDDAELAGLLRPPMTVVSQPFRDMAENAVRRISEAERARTVCRGTELFPVTLIKRESVKKIPEYQKSAG